MPAKQNKSSPLINLATLWMAAVSADARRGDGWQGVSHDAAVLLRSGQHQHYDEQNVLVKNSFHVPLYPNSVMRPQGSFRQRAAPSSEPTLALSEANDGSVDLTMEVPGVLARDLSVELEDETLLRVSGVRNGEENGRITQTQFSQQIRLENKEIDFDKMKVNLSSGILQIHIPKKAKQIRKLSIETKDPKGFLEKATMRKQQDET